MRTGKRVAGIIEQGTSPRSISFDLKQLAVGLVGLALCMLVLFELGVRPKLAISRVHFHEEPNSTPQWLGVELDYSKTALIMDTRVEPGFIALLLHFVWLVPPEWPFLVLGSIENVHFLRQSAAVRHLEQLGKLNIRELDQRFDIGGGPQLSRVMTDVTFYDRYVPNVKYLFVFQSDSILCSRSQQSLNDWLEWDYVGAPWPKPGYEWGGNGGLSLRNMDRIRRVLRHYHRDEDERMSEDSWLVSKLMTYADRRVPHRDVAKNFSVEGVWAEQPLGYHCGGNGVVPNHRELWWQQDRFERMKAWCPEIKLILPSLIWPYVAPPLPDPP